MIGGSSPGKGWEFFSSPPLCPDRLWGPLSLLGAPSVGFKRQGREADHSHPSSAEITIAWSYTSTPLIRLHGVMFS